MTLLLDGLLATLLAIAPAASPPPDSSFSFVVVGHVRRDGTGGPLHPRLAELIQRVKALRPNMVFLTGDMVWGDVSHDPADTVQVEEEWRLLDSALATLAVPVYRVPGNHDISDLGTRDLYFRRYGTLPQTVEFRGSRFFLLSSAWIPPDGDRRHNPFIRPAALDTAQLNFLRARLESDSGFAHTFVLQHHILWWNPDAAWWKDVHPVLAAGQVDAVFAGDYGPLKFSFMESDGVKYYQSALEGDVGLGILRGMMSSRLLAQQFDNFLYVTVRGSDVVVDVRVVGETSSGKFTPAHWREVNLYQPPERPIVARAWTALRRSPARMAALVAVVAVIFFAGWWIGRSRRRS
jgi:3',5'-cyclic AMP phosphodiesterase CpdA